MCNWERSRCCFKKEISLNAQCITAYRDASDVGWIMVTNFICFSLCARWNVHVVRYDAIFLAFTFQYGKLLFAFASMKMICIYSKLITTIKKCQRKCAIRTTWIYACIIWTSIQGVLTIFTLRWEKKLHFRARDGFEFTGVKEEYFHSDLFFLEKQCPYYCFASEKYWRNFFI